MKNNDQLKTLTKGRFVVAANAFIFKGEQILITKRSSNRDHDPNKWECVSGRFNQNFATVEDELTREVKEELGQEFEFEIIAPISFYHFYRGNDSNSEMVGINFICNYLSGEIKLSEEHTDYKWINPDALPDYDTDLKLLVDVKHLIAVKSIYMDNKNVFLSNFKKSN